MDFVNDNVHQLYGKFLAASMGSALALSIYSFIDTIAVGQSEGTVGAAAMAVITPLYGIIVFLAILCGIGGSVLMSVAKGEGREEKGNACFTAAVLIMAVLTAVSWMVISLFHQKIFAFFGADLSIMPKVMEYARWIIWFFPAFIAPTFLGAFIRNDGAPVLAMAAVIIGGCVNMFGDWFFVFPMGMGMSGAGLATALGTLVQVAIMGSHFFSRRCRLKLVKPFKIRRGVKKIFVIGFGASVLDLGTVIISILMNNQIMHYAGTVELAVYGVVVTVSCLFQAMFGGVGQAIQPLVSANCGAGRKERIGAFWRMSLGTVLLLGVAFTLLCELFPLEIVRLFVNAGPKLLSAAPAIVRPYSVLYLFLGVNVLSTYYLQSTMQGKMSMLIALMRSILLSGVLILVLPVFWGIKGVWIALPCSELAICVAALLFIKKQG